MARNGRARMKCSCASQPIKAGDTHRRTQGQLLRDLEQHGCVGLMRLLTGANGLPLLLMAARAFLCQELAQLLYRCLQENPEQTPDNCTLVLDIFQQLSSPQLYSSPGAGSRWDRSTMVAPGKRLETKASRQRAVWESPAEGENEGLTQKKARCCRDYAACSVGLGCSVDDRGSFTRGVAYLVAGGKRQALWGGRATRRCSTAAHPRGTPPSRRRAQRLIEEQRQIIRDEEARQLAVKRQREEEEHRRRLEAEVERQRAEDRAAEMLAQRRRQFEEERRARQREEQQRSQQARLSLEDGLTHAALRHDREALTTLNESLRLDPTLRRAWSARGVVRQRLGDLVGALEDFHEAVRRNPGDVVSWFQCGRLHAGRQEHLLAIDAFSAVLRLEPNNQEAYRQRGLCYGLNNDAEKAIADQTKVIELAPDDPWAYYYRANLHRLCNNFDLALCDYTAAIERNRNGNRGLAGAYRGRGMLFLHGQKFELALVDLSRALDLDPHDLAAQRVRGSVYLRNCDWNKALLDAESLIQHDAHDRAALKLRGQAYMGLSEYQRAEEDFTHVLQKGRDAETFYLRARAKVHLGDIQEAIFDCNDATALNPRLACAFYLRGKLNLRTGFRISGLDDCRTAHELDPQYPMP